MKRTSVTLFVLFALLGVFNVAAVTLEGKHYEGVGKAKGQAIDFWTTVNFDDEDAEISVANAVNLAGGYTATKAGNNLTVSVKVPGSAAKTLLKSNDNGATLEGDVTVNGQPVKLWLLETPMRHKEATGSTEAIASAVSSSDGYTSFIRVSMPGGEMCVTSDFAFNPDGTYTLTCDNAALQNIFGNMKGTYSIDGSKVTLTDTTGKTVTGTIYDDATYIKIPFGSVSGMTLTMVLIR